MFTMETIDTWFKREVHSWRAGAGIGWTVISLPAVFTVYTVLAHLYVFHPLSWITGSLSTVFSSYFIILLLMVIVISLIVCVFSLSVYSVVPDVPETRLHSLVQLLTSPRPLHGLLFITSGGIYTWICCNVVGDRYAHLSVQISGSDRFMLNECHLFLVLYGLYSGFIFLIFYYVQQNNYLQFNVLQQSKFFQVRSQVVSVLMKSVQCVMWQTLYFYPGYWLLGKCKEALLNELFLVMWQTLYFYPGSWLLGYWLLGKCKEALLSELFLVMWQTIYIYPGSWLLGQIPKDWIVCNLSLLRPEQPVDSIYGLLDIRLCYQTILLGTFLHFTWSYGAMLYRVYSTEHYPFPIESVFDKTTNRCLIDAISCQKDNLVKYLGFLDLCQLSKHSLERRAQIFSLSQPGGHPHNWNKLCTACLTEIDNLNQKIQEENWKVFANVPVRQTEKPTSVTFGDTTSTVTQRSTGNESVTATGDSGSAVPTTSKEGVFSYLKKKPVFSYFFMDLPDAKSRRLFQGAQLQIWAIEALSNFSTASYTEDKFGVVQRSLPSILTSLLNLQENVEKHFKLASTSSRRQLKDIGAKDAGLKYLLQTTLKSSLYKIINVFGKHVMSLKLQPEASRKLKQFIEYKE